MITYLGDFPTGQTIYIPFHTFSSDDPSASMTITGLAVTDIEIYKDGGTTQRSSDAGYTLLDTDGIDFDGATGIHGISIDTSDNTDAGFYAAGSDYWVTIQSITLDAATINFVAAIFSIDNRGLLRPTTAQRTLDVTATGAAGIDWGNVENKTTINDLSATDIQLCDTVSTLTGHTAQTADHTAGIADIPTVAEFNARTLVSADYVVTTDTIAGVTNAGTVTGNVNGSVGSVTGAVGSVTGNVGGNVTGSVGSVAAGGITAASIANAAIDNATFAADVGSTAYATNVIALAVRKALDDYDSPTKAEMDTGHGLLATEAKQDIIDTVVDAVKLVTDNMSAAASTMVTGTVSNAVAAPSTTVFYADDITEATADHYKGLEVKFTSGALQNQATDITAYALDTGEGKFTVTAMTEAPANNDTFVII